MTVIATWMGEVVRSGSWKRHDDLHLDLIVGERQKIQWLSEAAGLAREITATRDELAPSFSVVLGFGLQSSSSQLRPAWGSKVAFAEDLNESPPSIYMYERNTPEWAGLLSDNIPVKLPPFLAMLGHARYRQVWEESYREYWRSLLFVL